MSASLPIVCKPTPWFTMRAVIILVMFGVFAFLFYQDGSTGYRKKNLVFYLHSTFEKANEEFARQNASNSLSAEEWRAYAKSKTVPLPEDPTVLPKGTPVPLPWPEVLHQYDRMKELKWHNLWLEYSKAEEMESSPPEHPYDARKIGEQWVVFWICLAFILVSLFFLVRTVGRSIRADEIGVTGAGGGRVRYQDMKRLDLRKWETKGLAFIDFEGEKGSGKLRIDGLTYGGFKAEQNEPAERLMQQIRRNFRGEIIEYVSISDGGQEGSPDSEKPDGSAADP